MLTNISGVTDYVDSSSTKSTGSSGTTMGKDAFLTLLLAQLTHQDPLNPADPSQFASQLAQFSSLEQLTNVNENLTALKTSQDGNNKYQAMDLIGKEIQADGDTLTVGDSDTAKASFNIGSAADCAVVISNESGNTVRTINMGSLAKGDHSFTWDGKDYIGNEVADGSYTFKIIAQDSAGSSVTATTKISGLVDRVNLDDTDPVLYIGSLPVYLSEVTDIAQVAN